MTTDTLNNPPEFEEELDLQQLLPPHSMEAEQSVIGGLLIDSSRVAEVIELVTATDFFIESHQLIFRAIEQLVEDARPIDVTTVVAALESSKMLEAAVITAPHSGQQPSSASIELSLTSIWQYGQSVPMFFCSS